MGAEEHCSDRGVERENRTATAVSPGGSGEAPLANGLVVAGRYHVEGLLGSGGMGTVYRASDALLERPVALKLLKDSADETVLQRFRREALAGQDAHPNLVRTFEAGLWGGRLFMAMELAPSGSLKDRLGRGGSLPVAEVERLAGELLAGLAHLHARGIVHRDVKAGNVLLAADGTAKLADFGLARAAGDETVTVTRSALGTPAYMAPEVLDGERAGPPSDLYALGVVLYEAATGGRPFSGESHAELCRQHARRPPDPRPLAKVSRRLRALTLRLLEKDPRRRYLDAGACLAAWEAGRVRRPFHLRRGTRWAVAATLLVGAAVLASGRVVGAVRAESTGEAVRGVGWLGLEAWERPMGRVAEVLAVPRTRTLPAGFLVTAEAVPGELASARVVLLDRRGRTVRSFTPAEHSAWLGRIGLSGTLLPRTLLEPTDVDGDGWPDLLGVLYAAPWYVTFVAELFPDGLATDYHPLLANPGIIERVRFTDADGDGRGEWYVAALDNELLHTACVYRVDASGYSWPPPRLGLPPDFSSLAWFNLMSRRGGLTFQGMEVLPGGDVEVEMTDGVRTRLDRWGNLPDEVGVGEDPEKVSTGRLERYRALSALHLRLLDRDLAGARRALVGLAERTAGDLLAEGFRLLLEGRLALLEGDCDAADRLAVESFGAAPVSNDAPMLAVTARVISGRLTEAEELLEPRPGMTLGSPADSQELRGVLAWLRGDEELAWSLWEERGVLPQELGAQHRGRLLLGQDRAAAALEALATTRKMLSRERLGLLTAMAELRLGRLEEAERALAVERERHPWLFDEVDLVAGLVECRRGTGSRTRLEKALEVARQRARWDLYAHLDLPLHLALAADAALGLGERELARTLLAEAEGVRPGLEMVASIRAGL